MMCADKKPFVCCKDCDNLEIRAMTGLVRCRAKHITVENSATPKVCSQFIKSSADDEERKVDVTVTLCGTATVSLHDISESLADDYNALLCEVLKSENLTLNDVDWEVTDVEED